MREDLISISISLPVSGPDPRTGYSTVLIFCDPLFNSYFRISRLNQLFQLILEETYYEMGNGNKPGKMLPLPCVHSGM
jgi:hypothetical protein